MPDDSLRQKLSRLDPSSMGMDKSKAPAVKYPQRYARLAEAFQGQLLTNHSGALVAVLKIYPYAHRHGKKTLGSPEQNSFPVHAFTPLREEGDLRLENLLFIDTETTGLGGSGAVAFLVGCGSLTRDGFEIRQYLLPDYADEAALLEELSKEFSDQLTLVSYNGISFDLPLLRDRFIINRVAKNIPYQRHVDLLYPARRLFKRRLKECRLINMERALFDFQREDDVPGYLIPSLYFEWLSSENPACLTGVLEHNRLDILSLYFLAEHIADLFQDEGSSLQEVDDLHSLSRVYSRRKEHAPLSGIIRKMEKLSSQPPADDILLFNALSLKRMNSFDRAVSLWELLSESESKQGFLANVELSKFYEHKAADLTLAYHHALKAQKQFVGGRNSKEQLKKRILRLSQKLKSL